MHTPYQKTPFTTILWSNSMWTFRWIGPEGCQTGSKVYTQYCNFSNFRCSLNFGNFGGQQFYRIQNDTEREYSAFRQKFPKLWTSVAHSFLQQIAQNKNWAHPKATTLPRICKVEMQQASLLYYSAKPQSGGILRCALVCPASLYVRTIRFPTFCRSLPSVGAYSQYPAWSGCRRSADVPRADHDRVGSSPWQGGFKERVYCACLPSICLIFSTCKYAATAFNFKHKKTINVTDLSWPKTFRYRF